MGLLTEIQAALMEGDPIGPILLKLRFLASRLGSNVLEEWVKHESEGYPEDVILPGYRKVPVSYMGSFSGPFGSSIKNAPIPPYVIHEVAGDGWNVYDIRQGIAAIEDLVGSEKSGSLQLNDAANRILILQGKVYPDYACNSITGRIPKASLVEIQNAIRARVLELTIKIEKAIPVAGEISIGPFNGVSAKKEREAVTNITNQVIHGNYTSISNSGEGARFITKINNNDPGSVVEALRGAGISEADAKEIANIFSSETPESAEEPFGSGAKSWIAKNISKAADGTWKAGVAVATQVLTEAALKYYA